MCIFMARAVMSPVLLTCHMALHFWYRWPYVILWCPRCITVTRLPAHTPFSHPPARTIRQENTLLFSQKTDVEFVFSDDFAGIWAGLSTWKASGTQHTGGHRQHLGCVLPLTTAVPWSVHVTEFMPLYSLFCPQKDEPDAFRELGTGNRIATWLFYVSNS